MLLVTDGLLEASGIAGGVFEDGAFAAAVHSRHSLPVKSFIEALFNDLVDFHGSSFFEDDICIVGFEVK